MLICWSMDVCTHTHTLFKPRFCALLPCCQVRTDFCQRALPLIIHDILRGDAQGSWRTLLSSRIQDFFTHCSRHAQAASRPATPLPPDSGGSPAVLRGLGGGPRFMIWMVSSRPSMAPSELETCF